MKQKLILSMLFFAQALSAMEGTIETSGFVSNFVPPSPTNLVQTEQGCYSRPRTVEPEGRRLFNIYLPPGYDPDDTNTTYPVVYWLAGFNGNNETATNAFIQNILNEFINNGQIMPMIVVFPDASLELNFNFTDPLCPLLPVGNECKFPLADTPAGFASYGNSFYINSELNDVQYENYLIQELIPYIDANYNTIADRNFRAITGHSMGGYGSLYLGMKHPELFTALAPQSPTAPYTFTNNEFFDPLPPYPAYTLNSIFIGGILKNNNLVTPCNEGLVGPVGFQDFIFALSGALSPNTTGGTSFLDEYQVNLPIVVNPDGTASLIDGVFEVFNVFNPAFKTNVDKSVVLDESVIDIWHQNDPFFLIPNYIDTLAKQAIYFDGGNLEPWNNIGSRQMSDMLMSYTVDNEFFLYCGGHTDWLFSPASSRQTTVFKMFSGKFSTAGTCPEQISSKLIGTMTIELYNNASIEVDNGSILSIQTTRQTPIITDTNVTFNIYDNAAIHIGNATTQGGALQIGDPFTKAQLQAYNTGPFNDLSSHTVNCSILIDGSNALFEIGREGFFGLGMGINGKSNKNLPLSPAIANFWSVTSLANVQEIVINVNNGIFKHQVIASGDEEPASLLGLDLCESYHFSINPPNGRILGGGNLICTRQDPVNNPDCDCGIGPESCEGNANSNNVNRQIRLLHPTVLNVANNLPEVFFDAFLSSAAGIVNKGAYSPDELEPYYEVNVSSSTAYTNIIFRSILKSTAEFDIGNVISPFSITTNNLDEFCSFLSATQYEVQPIKLGNLSSTPETKVAFLQNASFIDNSIPFESQLISRVNLEGACTIIDELNQEMFDAGIAGVQIEFNGTKNDIPDEDITNVKELIRVYDSHLY